MGRETWVLGLSEGAVERLVKEANARMDLAMAVLEARFPDLPPSERPSDVTQAVLAACLAGFLDRRPPANRGSE